MVIGNKIVTEKTHNCLLKMRLHWPGIEPGPPAWQARILPLNHQCLSEFNRLRHEDCWFAIGKDLSEVAAIKVVSELFSLESQNNFHCCLGFGCITTLSDWFKKPALLCHPIRNKTKTNRDSLARISRALRQLHMHL